MASKDGRTEAPTPQRLRKLREEGQVAKSSEVGTAASLLGLAVVLAAFGAPIATGFAENVRRLMLLTNSGAELPEAALADLTSDMLLIVVPFLVAALIVGAVGQLGQVGLKVTPKALKPKAKRINPKQNAQKWKPSQLGWNLATNLFKVAVLGLILWPPLATWFGAVGGQLALIEGVRQVAATGTLLIGISVALGLAVAGADYAWQRKKFMEQARMRRDELKRELKDAEGDPQVKSRRREKARLLSRNRLLAVATDADVVVTNPTHYAVALRYRPGEPHRDPAPRVVAKGVDDRAAEMRRVAVDHRVPIVPNPPLARELFRSTAVGAVIPAGLFAAAAEVVQVAYRRRHGRPLIPDTQTGGGT